MIKYIQNIFRKEVYGTGVINDDRTQGERSDDYLAEEVASFIPVQWKDVPQKDWRKFPITNQSSSSSCVGHSIAKLLGIENWLEEGKFIHYSARDIYTRRKNFPTGGMWFQNGMEIGYKYGSAFEQLMPSYGKNEVEMNKTDGRTPLTLQVALVGRGGNYLAIPLDIEKIASIIEPEGKPVMIGVRFGPREWNRKVPVILGERKDYHHAVVCHSAILWKGKRALVLDDSWGSSVPSFDGRRILTEDWFKEGRISAAWYYLRLSNIREKDNKIPKPKYKFEKNLQWGMRNNDVAMLQRALMWDGIFPVNVPATGNYFSITARAVLGWQIKNNVAPIEELQKLKGRHFGPKSRSVMNSMLLS